MSYLELLKQRISENASPDQPPKPLEPSFGGLSGYPRGHISETQARNKLRQWHMHLSRLNLDDVPAGLDRRDWRLRCEDAWWLYENFASRAVRDGWGAVELFGVLPSRWGWGGLCDRLGGARDLKFGDDLAMWSRASMRESFCRGAADDLVASGLVPVWEVTG